MHLPKAQSDLARWRALDNYELRLFEVYKKFTDVWATAFHTGDFASSLQGVGLTLPSFQEGLIDYGLDKYPKRFSIQSCQLTGRRRYRRDDSTICKFIATGPIMVSRVWPASMGLMGEWDRRR